MKYLLCRPRGGLNDTLCQIEACWQYSELHNRVLIVDTEYLIATGIGVRFSRLFKPIKCGENVIFDLSTTLLGNLNQLSTYPPSCRGRLSNYKAKLNENLIHIDIETNTKISFDFNKNYEEDLLLHDQFGGFRFGIKCLARLKLTYEFRYDVLSKLLPLIGKTYIAIHVRNTDYQSHFTEAFKEIYEKTRNQRLLICSDSVEAINFANNFFDQSEIFTLSLPPDSGGRSLPTYSTFQCNDRQRYDLIVNAFSDLIGLAFAQEIIFCKLTQGKFAYNTNQYSDLTHVFKKINSNQIVPLGVNGFSGFSVLAESMRNNSSLINQLLTS